MVQTSSKFCNLQGASYCTFDKDKNDDAKGEIGTVVLSLCIDDAKKIELQLARKFLGKQQLIILVTLKCIVEFSSACFTIFFSVLNLSELQIEMRLLYLEQNSVGYDSKGALWALRSRCVRDQKKNLQGL